MTLQLAGWGGGRKGTAILLMPFTFAQGERAY